MFPVKSLMINNSNWSKDDNKMVIIHLRKFKLDEEKQKIINEQIQNLGKAKLFVSALQTLSDAEKGWEDLQRIISQNQKSNPKENNTQDYSFHELICEFQHLNEIKSLLFEQSQNSDSIQNFDQAFYMVEIVKSKLKYPGSINEIALQGLELTAEDLISLSLGVRKIFSYYPRAVQLLAVALLYNKNPQQGRLAQILTGEGKTLIVAMLAILICKKRQQNVDIVTSSPVLAKRDSQQYKNLYQYFQLTVSHNIRQDGIMSEEIKKCYECQIVYGSTSSFQADILRHTYYEQETMGTRQREYIIIDEVDSMLIDGHSNKTLISSPTPAMLDLQKVLSFIWSELVKASYNKSEDRLLFLDGDKYYSVNFKEYLEEVIQFQLNTYFKQTLPDFRFEYCQQMWKVWLNNALLALFILKEKKDYSIIGGKVRIIDYQNTGVIQSTNTQWEQGLHQFIQLKHGLQITPLTIASNFISNVTFFRLYGHKLIGLTGTIGSKNTQQLLATQYDVDFVFIPPFRQRILIEEPGYVLQNENSWLGEIERVVLEIVQQRRAVLIINKTISDVEKIVNLLKKYNLRCFKYIDDQQDIPQEIVSGQVIIATNLAGRGADFITNEQVEINGGLHVILSFLPQSIRVQEQGFGRTCRQGKKGSAQLIIDFNENVYSKSGENFYSLNQVIQFCQNQKKKYDVNPIEAIKFLRDQNEQVYMGQIQLQMEKLVKEDQCFEKFCYVSKRMANINTNKAVFKSLEEKWGIYLALNQKKGLIIEEVEKLFQIQSHTNPSYLVQQALEKKDPNILYEASKSVKDAFIMYHRGLFEVQDPERRPQVVQVFHTAIQYFQQQIYNEEQHIVREQANQTIIEMPQQVQVENNENQNNTEDNGSNEQREQQIENEEDYANNPVMLNQLEQSVINCINIPPPSTQQQTQNVTQEQMDSQNQMTSQNIIQPQTSNQAQHEAQNYQNQLVNQREAQNYQNQMVNQHEAQKHQNQPVNQQAQKHQNQMVNQHEAQKHQNQTINQHEEQKHQNQMKNQDVNQQQTSQEKKTQGFNFQGQHQKPKQNSSKQNFQKPNSCIKQSQARINYFKQFIESCKQIIDYLSKIKPNQEVKIIYQDIQKNLEIKEEDKEYYENVRNDIPSTIIGEIGDEGEPKNRGLQLLAGLAQVTLGGVCFYFGAGYLFPIATNLVVEGCSDIYQAIKNSDNIDWADWKNKKLTSYVFAGVLSGSLLLSHLVMGYKFGALVLQNTPFKVFLKATCLGGFSLLKLISTLKADQKQELSQVQKIFQEIKQIAVQFGNLDILLNKTSEILMKVQKKIAQEIMEIVQLSIEESKYLQVTFQQRFQINCLKYLKILISKLKATPTTIDPTLVFQKECTERLNSLTQEIEKLKIYKSSLELNINSFGKAIIEQYFNQDEETQALLLILDVKSQQMGIKFQQNLLTKELIIQKAQSIFRLWNKEEQKKQLALSFTDTTCYERLIKPLIHQIIKEFQTYLPLKSVFNTNLDIEINLWGQKLNQKCQNHQQIIKDKTQEQIRQINAELQKDFQDFKTVQEKKNKKDIDLIFIALANSFNENQEKLSEKTLESFNIIVKQNVKDQILQQYFTQVMQKLIKQAQDLYKKNEKFFSSIFKESFEKGVLSKIKWEILNYLLTIEEERLKCLYQAN